MHYTFLMLSSFAYTVDPAESEFEETPEPVQAEGANPEPEQGKHRCIQPISLTCACSVVFFKLLIVH
jgi:hypothetical protein